MISVENQEHAVAISAYCGEHPGFSGLVKHRWEDFHVHEVDEGGAVVHLTELQCRSSIIRSLNEKKITDSGDGIIVYGFCFDEATRESLSKEGCLSAADINRIEKFISSLAYVSDPPPSTSSITNENNEPANSPPVSSDGTPTADALINAVPLVVRSQITVRQPPYCLVLGNFESCVKLMKAAGEEDMSPSTVWKALRKAIHNAIRSFIPFLSSETLGVNDLSSNTDCFNDQIPEIRIPTESAEFPLNNRRAVDLLAEMTNAVTEVITRENLLEKPTTCLDPSSSFDQFSRVVRLFPKLPCLGRLFTHLRTTRATRQSQQQFPPRSVPADSCNAVPLGKPLGQQQQEPFSKSGAPAELNDDERTQKPFLMNQPIVNTRRCRCPTNNKRRRGTKTERKENSNSGVCWKCGGRLKDNLIGSHSERWPKDRPPYLRFHLWKCNRDTAEVINMIATAVGCSAKLFTFAGTKDRRAVTVQAVTAYKVTEQQMKRALLHPKWDKNVRISDFRYQNDRIHLGALQGNHFRVCIRGINPKEHATTNCEAALEKQIETASSILKENGFVNFFGLQRFGTRAIGTHIVGVAILKQHYETAVRLILGDVDALRNIPGEIASKTAKCIALAVNAIDEDTIPEPLLQDEDDEGSSQKRLKATAATESGVETSKAIPISKGSKIPTATGTGTTVFRGRKPHHWCDKYLEHGDAEGSLEILPRHFYLERQVLKSLADRRLDYIGALQKLPKNTLTLYVHAVQSLIWNHVASHRINTYGLKPVIGDLVLTGQQIMNATNLSALITERQKDEEANDTDDLVVVDPSAIYVIESEEDAMRFKLSDIVLPIPGDRVKYPEYLLSIYESGFQHLFGMDISVIGSLKRQGLGEYSGGYRHVVGSVTSLEYEVIHNVPNGTKKLLQTDVDRLLKDLLPKILTPGDADKSKIVEEVDEFTGTSAVLLHCTLPKSSYITMALRELFRGNEIRGY